MERLAHFSRSTLVGELVVRWVFIGQLVFQVSHVSRYYYIDKVDDSLIIVAVNLKKYPLIRRMKMPFREKGVLSFRNDFSKHQ